MGTLIRRDSCVFDGGVQFNLRSEPTGKSTDPGRTIASRGRQGVRFRVKGTRRYNNLGQKPERPHTMDAASITVILATISAARRSWQYWRRRCRFQVSPIGRRLRPISITIGSDNAAMRLLSSTHSASEDVRTRWGKRCNISNCSATGIRQAETHTSTTSHVMTCCRERRADDTGLSRRTFCDRGTTLNLHRMRQWRASTS